MRIENFWIFVENMTYSIMTSVCRFCGKTLEEKKFLSLMQFVKFGIIGVSNTLLSYSIYTVGLVLFRKLQLFEVIDYLVAQIAAFVISVLWSFYWNNRFVFVPQENAKRRFWKALAKTYATYSFTGLFLNSILLFLWVQVLHISEFAAPIFNLMITVPLNYLMNKFWAFKQD